MAHNYLQLNVQLKSQYYMPRAVCRGLYINTVCGCVGGCILFFSKYVIMPVKNII